MPKTRKKKKEKKRERDKNKPKEGGKRKDKNKPKNPKNIIMEKPLTESSIKIHTHTHAHTIPEGPKMKQHNNFRGKNLSYRNRHDLSKHVIDREAA